MLAGTGPLSATATRLPAGPSIALDTACSSSLLALQNAYHAIRSGECPAAIVGGINVLLKPNTSVQFMKLGMLSPDGACKAFDSSGEGLGSQGKIGGRQGWAGLRLRLRGLPRFSLRKWLLSCRGCGGSAADQEVPGPEGVCHHPQCWHQHGWEQGTR